MSIKEKINKGWEWVKELRKKVAESPRVKRIRSAVDTRLTRAKEAAKRVIKAPLTKQLAKTALFVWLGYLAYWWLPVASYLAAPESYSAWHMFLKNLPLIGDFIGKALLGVGVGSVTLATIVSSWKRYFTTQKIGAIIDEKIQRILEARKNYREQKEKQTSDKKDKTAEKKKTSEKGNAPRKKTSEKGKDAPTRRGRGKKGNIGERLVQNAQISYIKGNNNKDEKVA